MKKILIVSSYPTEENIKDGMVRRVSEIDGILKENYKRIYLDLSFRKNLKLTKKIEVDLEIYKLNFFKDYTFVLKLIKENEKIYIHSLGNYFKIFFIPILKNKKIILDTHGVVPEELEFQGKKLTSKIFNFLERKLFEKLNKAIFVTKEMEKFYNRKYPEYMKNIKTEIFPIIENKKQILLSEINQKLKAKIENKLVIIYSGNLQKWQNIDLMMDTISKNLSEKVFYIILTGQKGEMIQKFKEKNISEKFYFVDSVLPEELSKYYEIANYGFVLRDDHTLNRVANPTKLGEYLDYGIIPIVKLQEIGDYKTMGYEYITIDNFNDDLPRIKSKKNIEIMKKYRENSEKIDFLKFIEE
ncbi:MAG: hypothetical protein ACRCZ2_02915 [Fusobacteriaceae bacterium]